MQKKLIALAIAGLSSAAFAQTNVTVYGVADVSFESVKATGSSATNIPSRTRLTTNGSLLGFKGSEDLGDGLKAIFQFESSVNTDSSNASPNALAANTTGTTGAFSTFGTSNSVFGSARDTYVGLSGGFGTVKLGYLSTPLRSLVRGYDVMPGSTGVGEIGGVFATVPAGSLLFRTQSVRYDSPNLAGFTGSLAYIPNEGKSNSVVTNEINPNGWNLGLNYAIGGLKVGYTYLILKDAGVAALLDEEIKSHIAAASYDFGQGTSLTAQYQVSKDDRTTALPATTGDLKRKAFWVGAKHVQGANEFALSFGKAKQLEGSLIAAANDTEAKQISLRYGYSLSKRTQAYAVASKIKNGENASFDFGTGAVGGFSAGADPTAYGAGLRHSF